ncbi:hypothetical protein N665_0903s0002 [Sinapis alba]|nr:hypothetical protein N665_0903s0002 [Sinapis alba]
MGITILLLDEKDFVIHGFIPANRASHYRVARCAHMYKITEHQFMIRFVPATGICEVKTDVPVINPCNTNLELPDVVGEIRSVQGSDLIMNTAATTRVVVRLLIEPNVTVYLSLWDEAASTFRGLLKVGDKSQSVMLVTIVNPKLFGGNLYLNSTPGTRFFFDTNLLEIAEYARSVGGASSQVFPCVDTLERIRKKELVSIADLNTYISNSNEQETDFLYKANIVGVLQQNGWSFVSCTGCNKKLEKFRVELAVDSATFVVFDKEMTKLTKQEVVGSNGVEEELPSCLEELTGKEFVFQIRVTSFNFTPNHRTFTVSTITEDTILEKHGKDHGGNSSSSGDDVGLAVSPNGSHGDGGKNDEKR